MYGASLFAQENNKVSNERPLNSININLLGNASNISVNYQRIYFVKSNFFVSGKIGFGYYKKLGLCLRGRYLGYEPCKPPKKISTITHHITGNWGKKRSYFELGIGGSVVGNNYLMYPIIGYRLLPLKSDINFRIFGEWPIIKAGKSEVLFIPIGLELGVSF